MKKVHIKIPPWYTLISFQWLFGVHTRHFTKWVIYLICFGVFPFLFIISGIEKWYLINWESVISREKLKAQRTLERIIRESQDERFYYFLLKNLADKISSAKNPVTEISRIANLWELSHPGLFKFFLLDTEGMILFPENMGREEQWPEVARFVKSNSEIANKQIIEQTEKTLFTVFNFHFLRDELLKFHRRKRLILPLDDSSDSRMLFLYASATIGLFCKVNRISDYANFPLFRTIERVNELQKQMIAGVWQDGKINYKAMLSQDEVSILQKALCKLEFSNKKDIVWEDYLITRTILKPGQYLWGMVRLPVNLKGNDQKLLWTIFFILLLIFFAIKSYQLIFSEKKFFFSIQHKVLFLLIFGVGMPLIYLLSREYEYVQKAELAITQNFFSDSQFFLETIDKSAPLFLENLEKRLSLTIQRCTTDSIVNLSSLTQSLVALMPELTISAFFTFESNGSFLKYVSPGNTDIMLGSFLQTLVELSHSSAEQTESNVEKKSGEVKISVEPETQEYKHIRRLKNLAAICVKERGKLRTLGPLIKNDYVFYQYFPKCTNGLAASLLVYFQGDVIGREFFRRYIELAARQSPESRVWAIHSYDPGFSIPRDIPRTSEFLEIIDALPSEASVVFEKIELQGVPHYFAGFNSKFFPNFNLIKIFPRELVKREIRTIRKQLFLFAIGCLTFAVLIGTLFAKQILAPVKAISAGIAAMRAADFRHRIKFTSNDELGELAENFNNTMDHIEQIYAAKVVQKSMFPDCEEKIGHIGIYGLCSTAGELGGDYFDYFPIEGDRLVVLIGDVTGHGVVASLIVAMVKGVVLLEVRRDPKPLRILKAVNEVLISSGFRKRLSLTMFFGVLDTRNGVFSFANAGQTFPILISSNGTAEALFCPGYPLGVRKPVFTESTIELIPNTKIWLYTDGLPEAKNPSGEYFGYQRLRQLFRIVPGKNLKEKCEGVLRVVKKFCANAPQEDDMTLVLIEV